MDRSPSVEGGPATQAVFWKDVYGFDIPKALRPKVMRTTDRDSLFVDVEKIVRYFWPSLPMNAIIRLFPLETRLQIIKPKTIEMIDNEGHMRACL